MLGRLVESLRLRFAVAITLAELRFLRAWVTLKARCGMRRDVPPDLPSPSKRGVQARKKMQGPKRGPSQRVTKGKRNAID